jgi:YidC/Oxa1 family membrane protein insertase
MDKQSILGFILIAVVFALWMYFSTPDQKKDISQEQHPKKELKETDTISSRNDQKPAVTVPTAVETKQASDRNYGQFFASTTSGESRTFTVETDLYSAVFSAAGGGIKSWTLRNFFTWNKKPLQLIDWELSSDVNVLFGTLDGKLVDTKNLFYTIRIPQDKNKKDVVTLKDSSKYTVEFLLPIKGDTICILKRFTLQNGTYYFDCDIEMRNMKDVIANSEYQVIMNSLALTEENSVDESSFSQASAMMGGEIIKLDASESGKQFRENKNGPTTWISTHNKYFMSALVAKQPFMGTGVYMEGEHLTTPNQGVRKRYQASMKIKYQGAESEKSSFKVFIGPMDYNVLKGGNVGLENVLSLGWTWVVKPISEYIIIPLFNLLHRFIANFGLVIILFTIIIKIVLQPLTKSSMVSMRKMQQLQPIMNEIREKYKDDQQRQNTETMKLYKDYGINPAGGCLPLILQMPILFALFAIFRSTIDLRQQPFVGWINDLASPDIIVRLPFTIPLVGMNFVSGLALAMAITMFFQQKMSVKDPRQQAMVYIMPVMFWFMFNSFPSGLNLYYFLFNLLSIIQQYYLNKKYEGQPLQKVTPKKGAGKGWMERAMESAQVRAKSQKKNTRTK